MRKKFSPFKTVFWLLAIIFGIALAVSYCSVYINPVHFWIPAFFGLYFVPLVIINFTILFLALLKRSTIAWIPFISLLPTLLFVELFIRWGENSETGPEAPLKIASYNVHSFTYGQRSREDTMNEINRFLNQERVDIVCLQEFFCTDTGKIHEFFPSYPYLCFGSKSVKKAYQGNLILSRYPLENTGEITFPDSQRNCIYADYHLDGREFRIYNTHLESNNISLNAIADRLHRYQEAPDEFIQAHRRIREAFKIRARQVEAISKHLKSCPKPYILCGDFNDTPVSYTYHRLQDGLQDSFRQAGNGFGATYRYLWPSLRIDFILYHNAFTAKTLVTPRLPFSDHYPVVTELIP